MNWDPDNPAYWIEEVRQVLQEVIDEHGDLDHPEMVMCFARLQGCLEWLNTAESRLG